MAYEIFYKLCEEEELEDACKPCEICPYFMDCAIIVEDYEGNPEWDDLFKENRE